MVHLREVLRALRGAGLTANPKKCAIGRVEVRYLGFHLGHGQVRPQIDKILYPETQDQKGGEAVPGAGRVLQEVYS